jgi:DNA (cytosine-5)-methyltransferase 1
MTIRFFDMFAGVGGFRAGLERAGGYECAGHCEIDKHAAAAYRRIFKLKESEVFYEDATKIDTSALPEFDLLCAGFPCQSFSIAGKRRGFSDPRGTMFFELARLVGARRPSYLLLENVPGLLSHDKGRTFAAILDTLCGLGYSVEWQVLDSRDFGVPQARRRVYLVGYSDPRCAGQVLPVRSADEKAHIQRSDTDGAGHLTASHRAEESSVALLIKDGTARGYKEAIPGDSVDLGYAGTDARRGRVGAGIAHTLNTGGKQGVVTTAGRIRRLTPRECFRLQGFTDAQIDRLLERSSDTQAYKQAGNAVTVNVVHALALRLKEAHAAAMAERGKTSRPVTSRSGRVTLEFNPRPNIPALTRALIAIAVSMGEKEKPEKQTYRGGWKGDAVA